MKTLIKNNKTLSPIQINKLAYQLINQINNNLLDSNDLKKWRKAIFQYFYPGISLNEIIQAFIYTATSLIEENYKFNNIATRVLLYKLKSQVFESWEFNQINTNTLYQTGFINYIHKGINANLLDSKLNDFDLTLLSQSLKIENDYKFNYLGLKTLSDRYLLALNDSPLELPQYFWMRIAMGLALNEGNPNEMAIKFYNLMSDFDFIPSTPTLFNSGTKRSQLSSCFITTINDDLEAIYDSIKDNALLSKYSGGLGNDWTNIRGLGAYIKGTNGKSQGLIPFLKVANDTAIAVNQGGKRNGAVCAYLETWHIDIEDFLELRKNTGDDRRRTHDMNTANWIPDLFMQRVIEDSNWTLFSPDEVGDLHEKFGPDFKTLYEYYEKMAQNNQLQLFKTVRAKDLWRKMLTSLYETGHPWITFKDPCNLRNPQQHVGVIHSSNLCTEITLNTSQAEIAVCNLGSINLVNHLDQDRLDQGCLNIDKVEQTCNLAVRMLDNVIDLNYYAVDKAFKANSQHRPIGLGIMGFQDALYKMHITLSSERALKFADNSQEAISYFTIMASSKLARQRGKYPSYQNSFWDQGILPIDSLSILDKHRQQKLTVDNNSTLDWSLVRQHIQKYGMRNSNCMAIAPTATIANIIGVTSSIEPTFENIFVKSNLSGDFILINEYLIQDLQKLNLWNSTIINTIKAQSGSIQNISEIPSEIKQLYKTAFEIDPLCLIKLAAKRQKWIDQAISLNLYTVNPSGKILHNLYLQAWLSGLKTTYYLRSKSATNIEKSTITTNSLNQVTRNCLTDNTCEVCQ